MRSPLSEAVWITSKKKCSTQKRNGDIEETNAKLDSQLNELEQYGRRQNLEIHGISMPDNEPMLKSKTRCCKFSKKLT